MFQQGGTQRTKKNIKLEPKTFSGRILSGYSTTFGILGKNYFFTVKVYLRLLNVKIAYWKIKILYTTIFGKIW